MAGPVTGGCLCGAITYTVSGPMRQVVGCHCQQCRKSSGHFVAATAAKRSNVVVNGAPVWYQSSSYARRGFCGTCGSSLFWDGPDDSLSIMAGTLDAGHDLTMAAHIFCADKGAYYALSDDLPKSDSYEAAMNVQVPETDA